MKRMRALSLALAVLTTLSLLAVPAAATFSDLKGHWAREDVEYLAGQGVVKGLSADAFAPNQKMTACEALLFCSRAAGVDDADKAAIAAAWDAKLRELLPSELYGWAAQEMAVCLETGILSETELRALSGSDGLLKAISRETLAMYLVRAMQLTPVAQSLTAYPMSFADTASISPGLQPYVYVLNMYGIVKGDEQNRFLPRSSLTRAEMATMLRRAIDFMAERGIYAELPAYTSYDWVGGTITQVSAEADGSTALVLDSVINGSQRVSLPADVVVYENNMRSSVSALKTGVYARINLDAWGAAHSVRLGGALTVYRGTVSSVEQGSILLDLSGVSKRLVIDRFTAVRADGLAGDSSVIEPQAGYTSAVCYVDALGHLAALELTGGAAVEEGILTGVESRAGGQTLQVSALDGQAKQYNLPAGAGVTVDGAAGALSAGHVGDYVRLRLSGGSSGQLSGVAVDTTADYVQGTLQAVSVSGGAGTLTLVERATGRSTVYPVSDQAVIRLDGADSTLERVEKNSFATLRLTGGAVIRLEAYSGGGVASSSVAGSITRVVRESSGLTLDLRLSDGATAIYAVSEDVPVTQDGVSRSLYTLGVDDSVTLEISGSDVVAIQVERSGDSQRLEGTIRGIDTDRERLELRLTGGGTVTVDVSEASFVASDGGSLRLSRLEEGDRLQLFGSYRGSRFVAELVLRL